jgi:16S rRNA G1207 methylase RsmC
MSSCCDARSESAARQFGETRARNDLAAYSKARLARTTRHLLEGLIAEDAAHGTLLDIGSGVGVLTLELLAVAA